MSGAEQAVVTHLDEAVGEHVLEEAPDELFRRDGATLELVSGRLLVSESDLASMQLAQAVVTDSDALLQFGRQDDSPNERQARLFFDVASEPKTSKLYDARHHLNDEARKDRIEWLTIQLRLRA